MFNRSGSLSQEVLESSRADVNGLKLLEDWQDLMPDNTKKALEELHSQLSTVQLTDAAKQKQLGDVKDAVRASLDDPSGGHHRTLRERLEKAVVAFEVDHPQIAHTLRAAIDSLSEAGF